MKRTVVRIGTLAACAILSTGCGEVDPIVPPDATAYELVLADGRALPRTRNWGGGSSSTLFSDLIVIFEDRRYERTTVIQNVSAAMQSATPPPTEVGLLVPTGERFVMQFECPDFAVCIPPDTIAFTAKGAMIEGSYLLGGSDLQYRTR